MSSKKDGSKRLTHKKQTSVLSNAPKKKRDTSEDRRHVKTVEEATKNVLVKKIETNIKQTTVDSKQLLKNKPVNSSRKGPTDSKSNISVRSKSKLDITGVQSESRILKTQFFPSKAMYANALKMKGITTSSSPKDITTTTNSTIKKQISTNLVKKEAKRKDPKSKEISNRSDRIIVRKRSDVKCNNENLEAVKSQESSSLSERPRTATLRKGSVANLHLVGPDAPHRVISKKVKNKHNTSSPSSDISDEYKYEDDFESYESDFEAYSSSTTSNIDDISQEETSSLSESDLSVPKESSNKINSTCNDSERKMDSGHFDMTDNRQKKVLHNIIESIERENVNINQEFQRINPASLSDEGFEDQKSLQFINFLDAKKKTEHRKSMQMKRKRGDVLLNMIKLDTYSFTLFDLLPVPYKDFIKRYGQRNTEQCSTQTGEDDVSEKTQTETITYTTKWSQYPVCFSKMNFEDPYYWRIYRNEYLGVGTDEIGPEEETYKKPFKEAALHRFVISVGGLIIRILNESKIDQNNILKQNDRELPFSKGFIQYNLNNDFLKDTYVANVSFCCYDDKFMSVHIKKDVIDDCQSFIAIWNVNDSEQPDLLLSSHGKISCCCSNLMQSTVYAGLEDGSIAIWSLKNNYTINEFTAPNSVIYCTNIADGHGSNIVSINVLNVSLNDNIIVNTDHSTNEICTLDEEGDIILWSVIDTEISNLSNKFQLVRNSYVSLKLIYPELTDLSCRNVATNPISSNTILISTNYGFILQHLIKGGRSNVKKFQAGYDSNVSCLDICPFSEEYFLAGFENGNIKLYSRNVAKPLMVMSNSQDNNNYNTSLQFIQWSKTKPFIIYAKDKRNDIHIWDLNESDIFPIYTIPFDKNITCMKLSPYKNNNDKQSVYMVIGTENSELFLHQLNDDHGPQPADVFARNVKTFLDYAHRL